MGKKTVPIFIVFSIISSAFQEQSALCVSSFKREREKKGADRAPSCKNKDNVKAIRHTRVAVISKHSEIV